MEYAIVEIGGSQQRVSPGDTIRVNRLPGGPGSPGGKTGKSTSLSLDRVLLVSTGRGVSIGTPTVEGASVRATLIAETKGKKVIVFKKKKRKQYRRTRGHRSLYTTLRIDSIQAKG